MDFGFTELGVNMGTPVAAFLLGVIVVVTIVIVKDALKQSRDARRGRIDEDVHGVWRWGLRLVLPDNGHGIDSVSVARSNPQGWRSQSEAEDEFKFHFPRVPYDVIPYGDRK